jgi:hypothetical protein
MPLEFDARLALSEYLTALVAELNDVRLSDDDNLTYDLNGVTLELDIAYTLKQTVNGQSTRKPEFWVLHSGPGDERPARPTPQSNTQRLTLRLTPRRGDVPAGEPADVNTVRLPREQLADVEKLRRSDRP